MFKLLSDTFIIDEIINSSSSEALLESEITLPTGMPNIEKIISNEGKIKIGTAKIGNNKTSINGDLEYNIIYRSDDEDSAIYSLSGTIPFTEEILSEGSRDGMDANVNAYIDYIDTEQLSENSFLIKAILALDTDIVDNKSVDFISTLESDGSFQVKTKNISYTDIVNQFNEVVNVSDTLEVGKLSGEIADILKTDFNVYISNIDMMNEKMLIEGILKAGFLFSEEDSLGMVGYVSEEFPFTHYIEIKDVSDDMIKDLCVSLKDVTYNISENYDNEKKLIDFNANIDIDAKFYDTVEKNIITDGYSTQSQIDVDSTTVNLSSIKNIKNETVKFENNFDVMSGTVKDIYTVDISPKISEKRVLGDKYIIDGFLDVNVLYLNGDINRMDKAYTSIPFTSTIDLSDDESDLNLSSSIKIGKSGAYRKGNSSIVVNGEVNISMKFRDSDEISIISNITESGPLDTNKMPSLIFRVVQDGETIWDIAKNYNVSINYLKELNDFALDSELTPGSKIIIARRV